MQPFAVGDRVIAVSQVDGREDLVGRSGTVVHIRRGYCSIGVCFDEGFKGGHNCHGTCEHGRGRYGDPDSFVMEPNLDVDDEENTLLDSFLASYQK